MTNNKFSEIELDFKDVKTIGQGFADEVFRVFASRHPKIKIQTVRTNPPVAAIIKHVKASNIDTG